MKTLFQKTSQATLDRWMAYNAARTAQGQPWVTLDYFVAREFHYCGDAGRTSL